VVADRGVALPGRYVAAALAADGVAGDLAVEVGRVGDRVEAEELARLPDPSLAEREVGRLPDAGEKVRGAAGGHVLLGRHAAGRDASAELVGGGGHLSAGADDVAHRLQDVAVHV